MVVWISNSNYKNPRYQGRINTLIIIIVFNLLSVIVETKSDLIDPLNMTNTSTSSLLNTNVHDVFDLCYHKFSLGPKSQVINRPETLKLCSNPKYVVKRQSHVIVSSVKPSRLYRHSGYFNDNPRLIPVSIPLSPTSESTGWVKLSNWLINTGF